MTVTATKNNVTDEQGTLIKSMYYLKITNSKGHSITLNIGKPTYDSVNNLNSEDAPETKKAK